jgi:catechol 2,3-dioxygenase-like lactoylglutathione lyase family enzyme
MSSAKEIAFVIHTTSFDESIGFYCESLGLELVEEWRDGGHGAVIRLMDGAHLELIELDDAAAHGGVALGLEVDDVDVWYARLTEASVKTKAPPIDAFGKRGFGTTDPNGVAVNIYTTNGNG